MMSPLAKPGAERHHAPVDPRPHALVADVRVDESNAKSTGVAPRGSDFTSPFGVKM